MPLRDHIRERIQKSAGPSHEISNAGIWDEDIDEIITLANANPNITNLYLNCNNIEEERAKKLTSLLYVKDLDVSQNNFDDDAAIALVSVRQFISLDISRNRAITDKTGQFILENAHHITLNVSGTDISDKLCEQISERIKNNLENYYASIQKKREENKSNIKPAEMWEEKTAPTSPASFFSKTTVQTEKTNHSSDNKYSLHQSLANNKLSK